MQLEERFRELADCAPVMIWVSGCDKLCTWFNSSWLKFVGIWAEAAPDRGAAFYFTIPAERGL